MGLKEQQREALGRAPQGWIEPVHLAPAMIDSFVIIRDSIRTDHDERKV
jgi:hypothetical protein